jgi:lipid-binding SYLF domain-containing protein
MKRGLLCLIAALPLLADRQSDDIKRIDGATTDLIEMMHASDGGVPEDLMQKAHCVGIIPGMKRLGFGLMKDKVTIGGEVAAMAGPVGRTVQAQTDAMMTAEILSWSRSRGVFAGVDLNGASLRPDNDDNRGLYGRDVTQREILHGDVTAPPAATRLHHELERYAFHERTGGF